MSEAPPVLPSDLRPGLLHVAAFEADIVRLFQVDDAAAPDFARQTPGSKRAGFRAARLAGALGVGKVDPDHATLICIADLGEQGLEEYLTEGQGILAASLYPDLDMIAGLSGHVLVVTSPAFGGAAVTLKPQAGLRALGVWPRAGAKPPHLVLPSTPQPQKITPPGAQPNARPTTARLIALALLLAAGGLAIWYLR